MNMTKSQKKHLRYLAGIAYDRELGVALDRLFESYQQWKSGEIDAWDVNEEIHKHHNGISRELYNRYEYPDPCLLVARAIADGVLKLEEVNEDCHALLESDLEFFRTRDLANR